MACVSGKIFLASALLCASSAAMAGAVASNFRKESRRGANFWNAGSALDGNLDTCWMLPGETKNVGESITLDVPKSTLDKIGLTVGWEKDEETWMDYPRLKTLKVELLGYNDDNEPVLKGKPFTIEFEDTRGLQVIDVEDVVIGDDMFGGKVRLTVQEVYPGGDFPNLAISEVLLHLLEFDAAAKILEISSEDLPREGMVDDNVKSYWSGDVDGASLRFEADGYSLARVGLHPGPKTFSRAKTVEIHANGRVHQQVLEDDGTMQWIEIPAILGYTGSAFGDMELKIIDVYPGTTSPDKLAIAELDLKATAYDGI